MEGKTTREQASVTVTKLTERERGGGEGLRWGVEGGYKCVVVGTNRAGAGGWRN